MGARLSNALTALTTEAGPGRRLPPKHDPAVAGDAMGAPVPAPELVAMPAADRHVGR
jgi:hypothetical protein